MSVNVSPPPGTGAWGEATDRRLATGPGLTVPGRRLSVVCGVLGLDSGDEGRKCEGRSCSGRGHDS